MAKGPNAPVSEAAFSMYKEKGEDDVSSIEDSDDDAAMFDDGGDEEEDEEEEEADPRPWRDSDGDRATDASTDDAMLMSTDAAPPSALNVPDLAAAAETQPSSQTPRALVATASPSSNGTANCVENARPAAP